MSFVSVLPTMSKQHTIDLIKVLEAQLDLYRRVKDLLERESAALMSGRPDDVLELVHQKETLLLRIRTLEETRQIITARLAAERQVDPEKLKLSEIIANMTSGEQRARMSGARVGLKALMREIGEVHKRNAAVCHSGMQLISDIVEAAARENGRGESGGTAAPTGQTAAYGNAAKHGSKISSYRTTT